MIFFDYCRSRRVSKRNSCNRVRTLVPQIDYYDTEDRLLIIKKMLCARDLTDSTNTSLLSPWGKAYKRSVIMKYSIRFPVDVIICEDRLFNIEYYMRARTYAHVFRTVYYVTWRGDSLTPCCPFPSFALFCNASLTISSSCTLWQICLLSLYVLILSGRKIPYISR